MMDILLLLMPLEKAINTIVQSDEAVKKNLFTMQGKSFSVKLKGVAVHFYIVFSSDKIYFQQGFLGEPTVEVEAYPFSLLRLLLVKDIHPGVLNDRIIVRGDMHFAQKCKEFFRSLKIDWEYHLTPILGDVVVESTSRVVQKARVGLKNLVQNFRKSSVSYLQNEVNYLPHPYALDYYVKEVNDLRAGVDRLQARIDLLKNKIDQNRHH